MKAKCDMAKKIRYLVPRRKSAKKTSPSGFEFAVCLPNPATPKGKPREASGRAHFPIHSLSPSLKSFPLDALFYIPGVFAEDIH